MIRRRLALCMVASILAACGAPGGAPAQTPEPPSTPAERVKEAVEMIVQAPGVHAESQVALSEGRDGEAGTFLDMTVDVDTATYDHDQTMVRHAPSAVEGARRGSDVIEVRRRGTDIWVSGTEVSETLGFDSTWGRLRASIPEDDEEDASWDAGATTLGLAIVPLGLDDLEEVADDGDGTVFEGTFHEDLMRTRASAFGFPARVTARPGEWEDGGVIQVSLASDGSLAGFTRSAAADEFESLGVRDPWLHWTYSFETLPQPPTIEAPDPTDVTDLNT